MPARRVSAFLIATALIAGMAGCVSAQHSLTVSSSKGGKVTSLGEGTFTYYKGEVVSLIAVAEDGYRFANWAGDVSTVADPNAAATTITMNDDYSIRADFDRISVIYYTLTLAVSGNGSTSPAVGQHTYAAGAIVSITAAPVDGYRFARWTGSVETIANVVAAATTITMNADYSIMANFEEGEVTFLDPSFGDTVRGAINNSTGWIHPSDLQRHSFFAGAT